VILGTQRNFDTLDNSQYKKERNIAIISSSRPLIIMVNYYLDSQASSYGHNSHCFGIDAFTSILQRPSTLEEAIEETERLLTEAAEGWSLQNRRECINSKVMIHLSIMADGSSKDDNGDPALSSIDRGSRGSNANCGHRKTPGCLGSN
jgi:hypothetical protein